MDIRQNATSEINGRTSMSLSSPLRGPRRRFLIRRPLLRSCVGHAPNRSTSVVGNQQRPVFHYCQRSGASPHLGTMLTRYPETRREIFVASLRPTVLESHSNNLVARRLRAVPGALKRYECIPAILCRELAAVVENECGWNSTSGTTVALTFSGARCAKPGCGLGPIYAYGQP